MGSIYMVLTFSIMVPMALLTGAIIDYLSAELQTNDYDIQAGIQASLVKSLLEESCEDVLIRGNIEEVMAGDANRSEAGFQNGKTRYFILNIQPVRGDESPAYVLRGFTKGSGLSLVNMLPEPGDACNGEYQIPRFTRYDVCRVDRRMMLSRVNADWTWEWLADGAKPNTRREYLFCPDGLLLTRR